jgi:hypothetical protein
MSNELSLPQNQESTAAFLDIADAQGGLTLPTFKVVAAGDKSTFTPAPGNDEKDLDLLPDNAKARMAVFITNRIGVLAWATGYDDRGEGEQPVFCNFAAPGAKEDAELIGSATKQCQMMPRDRKSEYDFEKSKVGHVKPLHEVLLYLEGVGFTVCSVSPNFYNVVDGVKAIGNLKGPVVVSITPGATPHKTGKNSAFLEMTVVDPKSDKALALAKSFEEYRVATAEDLQTRNAVETWLAAGDRPMTDAVREALKGAIALNPPRF